MSDELGPITRFDHLEVEIIDGTHCLWCREAFQGPGDLRVEVGTAAAGGGPVFAHSSVERRCDGHIALVQASELAMRAHGLREDGIDMRNYWR